MSKNHRLDWVAAYGGPDAEPHEVHAARTMTVFDDNGEVMARDVRPEDAEFIVRAANSFDDLVEALFAVKNTDDHADDEVRGMVRAALRKAGAL